MSLVISEPKFDKLWKIVDDNIKTGKYKQIRFRDTDGKDGRCINGVFLSYCIDLNHVKNVLLYDEYIKKNV